MTQSLKKLVVICGPTAVGKTEVGVDLCKHLDGEIISADSQQVYRGMDIGTAKDDLTGSGVKCHLIDVVAPDDHFDASMYKGLADKAIENVLSRGRLPIVVGGTGFYIKVLLEGLCEAPSKNDDIRKELMEIKEKDGSEALYNILKREDATMAGRLHPNDCTRIIRAIEVKRITGKSLSELHKKGDRLYDSLKIGLNADRKVLYERINNRVDRMMERGLIKEVEGLISKYGHDIRSLKAVGYKEMVQYLRSEIGLDDAVRLTKQNTRHFAKRQLTWFNADSEISWYQSSKIDDIRKRVEKFIQSV